MAAWLGVLNSERHRFGLAFLLFSCKQWRKWDNLPNMCGRYILEGPFRGLLATLLYTTCGSPCFAPRNEGLIRLDLRSQAK